MKGVLSFMKGKMARYLSAQEHLALGVNVAWYPGFTHHVMWAAMWDFMRDFQTRGVAAWEDFQKKHAGYPIPDVPADPSRHGIVSIDHSSEPLLAHIPSRAAAFAKRMLADAGRIGRVKIFHPLQGERARFASGALSL